MIDPHLQCIQINVKYYKAMELLMASTEKRVKIKENTIKYLLFCLYAWYTFKSVRWSPSMCPNRAFASSAAFWASLGRTKQLGTKEKIGYHRQRRSTVGQQMHRERRDDTICFMREYWETATIGISTYLEILWCMPTGGMDPRQESCWWQPKQTHTFNHTHADTCVQLNYELYA